MVALLLVIVLWAGPAWAQDTQAAGWALAYEVLGKALAIYMAGLIVGLFVKLTNRS